LVSIASISAMSLAGWLIDAFGVREVFIVAGIAAFVAFLSLFPTVYREQLKIIRDHA
jgi:sugar phosphate permease